MHDIKLIRENPEAFARAIARRTGQIGPNQLVGLDEQVRALRTNLERLQAQRKSAAKAYSELLAKGDNYNLPRIKQDVERIKAEMQLYDKQLNESDQLLQHLLRSLPNLPADDVPDGANEDQNKLVSNWGLPRPFDFTPKEHADLGPALGLDFETGALISGARFTFLRGQMARLQRALGQFMLDQQTVVNGYSECAPPLLVRDEALFGTGQLPKFAEDQFETSRRYNPLQEIGIEIDNLNLIKTDDLTEIEEENLDAKLSAIEARMDKITKLRGRIPNIVDRLWLIPTAEVSLTNSVREQILAETQLPIRLTALTPCFRSEAGAAGKDTRGYIRQHQFEKVELVSVCRPEDSEVEHERMTTAAESILQALDLPYRKMLLCAGDMGFTARKTYDLEVWLPGQNAYREISSISNCGDFQARRMNTRYRPIMKGGGTLFVHTLNGSGLAVGRTLVAVLENYQQADGSVQVPPALLPYMGGITALVPN